MATPEWKPKQDPLYRGDGDPMSPPTPDADDSLVRHILYLDGPGRQTPYLSTTEQQSIAQVFAGRVGRTWETKVATAKAAGFSHLSKSELLQLLKGRGKGRAKWTNAYEVMQARRYVEQNAEHLLDSAAISTDLAKVLKQTFR